MLETVAFATPNYFPQHSFFRHDSVTNLRVRYGEIKREVTPMYREHRATVG